MQLTKLRLVGFKSFVEASDFDIQPGLTGIVGPNGCGKSNLVEALRWVMGESSYKSMRASGMDDVIFSGAGDRPARNLAEVGLTLDNASRTAPAAFNDADVLEITRRIEREQGSTYRINGREVRARDVQILFADAATGARSPALVRQGQIAEIIAAKPQARRRILEDAAGVAGLHTRRHEAELRLKGAEDNLTRIDDVIAQIAAQGDGLRRQARHANRYRELQADIRRTQALAVLIDHEEATREVDDARRRLAEAGSAVVECTRLQGEAARHQAVAAHALPALRDAEGAASAALQKVVVARETLDGEERRAKARFTEVERRIREMAADLARDAAVVEDAASMLARLGGEAEDLDAQADATADEASLAARLAEAERARAAAEAAHAAAQTRLADAEAQRRALTQRRVEEASRRTRLAQHKTDAEAALARLRADGGMDDALAVASATMQTAATAMTAADAEVREAEQVLARARDVEQAGRGPLAEADRATQRLETEVRTLAKLLESGAGAKWPPIADSLHVEKGYEAALGAALGDDLEASSDPRAPAHWAAGTADRAGDAPLPAGATPLGDVVRGAPALVRRLAQIGIVARADGPILRTRLRPGQRLVSREGDIWRWDGFTQAAEAPTPAARRLAERNRLADLRGDVAKAAATLAARRADADAAQDALRAATSRETQARAGQRDARRAHESAREAHTALERRVAESAVRLAALAAAAASAQAAHAEAERTEALAADALAALAPSDHLAAETQAARDAAFIHRAAETETRATLQAITRERQARERRRAAIAQELTSWDARRTQAAAHRGEIEGRLAEARRERDALAEAPDRFILTRRQVLAEVDAAEGKLRQAADARVRAETALADADRAARAALDAMAAAREANARAEARAEAAAQRLEAVVRTTAAELDCQPAALPAMAGVKDGETRPSAAMVAARLEQLKGERERLGAVNLRADEELASLEGQREGLDREKADLAEAIRRLRQAISSLNKEGRERLLGAFDKVNGHFKDLFTSLFGGGTAELQLVESDDPLEAGLEILARPPGKKPQVMTLLSGGEQALTAMSLIFAVFLTNPSPICVLDEVDAPLDDSNVERFCDLVDEMRKKTDTRFIAITHNPITMARMDRLFGVTMAERGVSQLVSVALAEAEEMLEAV